MAKIIAIEEEKITIGTDDGGNKRLDRQRLISFRRLARRLISLKQKPVLLLPKQKKKTQNPTSRMPAGGININNE